MAIYQEWLLKSKRDLDAAKVLLEKKYCDMAIYHTQQCAEKALKGYCVYKLQPLIKTHDLERINSICMSLDNDFRELDFFATCLNGLDVQFRYPDTEFEPTETEVEEAIQWAEQMLTFVNNKCL